MLGFWVPVLSPLANTVGPAPDCWVVSVLVFFPFSLLLSQVQSLGTVQGHGGINLPFPVL